MQADFIIDVVTAKREANADTLKFLRTILPSEGVYFLVLMQEAKTGPIHKPYASLEAMANAVEVFDKQPGVTVYHGCASYINESVTLNNRVQYRVRSNLKGMKAFWVDIDCGEAKAAAGKGYATKSEAGKAILSFCQQSGLPYPMLVSSGNGLHCYWTLTATVAPDEWKNVASQLKAALIHFGVLSDPSRTADGASILRPVGSHNKKNLADPKLVKVLRDAPAVDIAVITRSLSRIADNIALSRLIALRPGTSVSNDDLTAHAYDDVPAYVDAIVAKCGQARLFKETGYRGNEPSWKAMIGVMHLCVDGNNRIQEFSSNDKAYDRAETQRKIDACFNKPTTCAHIC
jgi:hypothetical protein